MQTALSACSVHNQAAIEKYRLPLYEDTSQYPPIPVTCIPYQMSIV